MQSPTRHARFITLIAALPVLLLPLLALRVTRAEEHEDAYEQPRESRHSEHEASDQAPHELSRSDRRFVDEHFTFIVERIALLRREEGPDADHEMMELMEWMHHFIPEMREMQRWRPEAFALEKRVMEMDHESELLGARIRATANEDELGDMSKRLESMLIEAFELKQRQRRLEAEQIERELKEIRAMIQRREERRDRIIDRRYQELTGEHDMDAW